ncbi:hypothetical protein Taro_015816, partial [Colocasia esculenta]|nr:hypothetical protein [Colocasia esculenta]
MRKPRHMASRGRRGGVPAREGEQRREEQAEQHALAPQGPVLPPRPPVDYGVFMQGLVQAMQTQAHTQAALQAQLEAQASSGDLPRLEDSVDIREHFPDSGVQRDSSQSPELGGFGGFLALAEESFSDLLIPLLIFLEA